MEANFQRVLPLVLKHEGGFVNHPADPGGHTNRGITLATMRRYIDRSATVDDLKRITDAQVAKVYRKHYWDKVRGDDLPSGVDYAVFDFAVNSGPTRAAKFLQEVLRVAVDGKIGPQTLAAARRANAADVIQTLCDKRMAFLRRLKNWPTFHNGWTSRVAAVRAFALDMAPAKPAQTQKPSASVPEPQTPETRSTEPGDAKAGALVAVLVALAATAAMVWEWLASLPCDLLGILCN